MGDVIKPVFMIGTAMKNAEKKVQAMCMFVVFPRNKRLLDLWDS